MMTSVSSALSQFSFSEYLFPTRVETEEVNPKTATLEDVVDATHRWGLTLTGLLPLSSRGIGANIALASIRALQDPTNSGFIEKVKEEIAQQDWDQGIQDVYTDLTTEENQELSKALVKKHFRYAAYLYMGLRKGARRTGDENGILVSAKGTGLNKIPDDIVSTLKSIAEELTQTMSFKVDKHGNYYHLETGTIFNLVYDKERKEIIVCFMGLKKHMRLNIDKQFQDKVGIESVRAVGTDMLGGIPHSVQQVIQIGDMLKKVTHGTKITPVMVGHSHGGSLAQSGAVANGLKGIVFNSRPMGAATRRYIGQSTVAENAKNITAYSVKGDWLSDNSASQYVALFEKVLGIVVPRTVGTGYMLPHLEDETEATNHGGFYRSFKILKEQQ
jgi:hypothetical protein